MLQLAQTRRVGRGKVKREIVRQGIKARHTDQIIISGAF